MGDGGEGIESGVSFALIMPALISGLRRALVRPPMGARFMGGHSMAEAIAETDKWKKVSYAFIPFCGLYAIFVTVRHNSHHHEHEEEPPQYPWMKKRDKKMPWTLRGGSECDLFDYGPCYQKEKAAKAAAAAAH